MVKGKLALLALCVSVYACVCVCDLCVCACDPCAGNQPVYASVCDPRLYGPRVCDRDQCVFVCTQPVFVCKRASVRVSVCDYVTRAVCAMLL